MTGATAGRITRREDRCTDRNGKKYLRIRYRAIIPDPDAPPSASKKIEKTFATRAEAQAWLSEQRTALATGSYIAAGKAQTLLSEVAGWWRETWSIKPLAPLTQQGYAYILERHILPEWGATPVCEVSAALVQAWVKRLQAQGLKAETVHHIYGVLRYVMKVAVQHKLVLANPCTKDAITMPSKRVEAAKRGEMRFLSAGELRQLVEALPERWRLPVRIAGIVGLRAGEVWGLRREDIDILHGTLRVTYAVKDDGGTLFAGPTKTYEKRVLRIDEQLRAELERALAAPPVRGPEGYAAIIVGDDGPQLTYVRDAADPRRLLFVGERGAAVSHNNFRCRIYSPVVRKLWPQPHRLHGLRFHDLRHTSASLMLGVSGHNLGIVQKRLGHESIETTFNRYGHLLPGDDQTVADALGNLYADAESNVVSLQAASAAR